MSKKMGRPKIEIDWVAFDKLCFIQCTLLEIASFFDCSDDTIERAVLKTHGVTFAEYHKKKSAHGKMSLRRKMFEMANNGNVTMAIWLSKQHLDMSDKREDKTEITAIAKTEIEHKTSWGSSAIEVPYTKSEDDN